MRIETIIDNDALFREAADCPAADGTAEEYNTYYTELLTQASEAQTELLLLRSIHPGEKTSETFARINLAERPVVNFLSGHAYPERVRFVCEDEETARLYKVVYNMFYAETKAARQPDDHWD